MIKFYDIVVDGGGGQPKETKPMTDYTKEAELMKLSNMLSKYHLEVDSVEGIGEKGTIQLSHARKFLDYAARQQSAAEIDRLRGEVERLTIDNMAHEFNQAEAEKFAPEYKRQIREDEANKWKEQVRKLREGLEEMISTIERNAVDNRATIENVKLWAKSWREELLTETEG